MYISTIVLLIGVPVANVTPWPGWRCVQIAGLHEQVECPLAAARLNAGDALHLGRRFQVLVILRLVDEHVVDSQLVEDEPVVFLLFGQEIREPLFAGSFVASRSF